jgi:hypothetical protein
MIQDQIAEQELGYVRQVLRTMMKESTSVTIKDPNEKLPDSVETPTESPSDYVAEKRL